MPKPRTTLKIGDRELTPPVWIIGPDVIESDEFTRRVAAEVRAVAEERNLSLIFKASYEKANRSSAAAIHFRPS